jgi:hypothetical protein
LWSELELSPRNTVRRRHAPTFTKVAFAKAIAMKTPSR